jgi:hypothetical protein
MIECVADALMEQDIERQGWNSSYAAYMRRDPRYRDLFVSMARAALEAMREPSEAMESIAYRQYSATHLEVYKAMIRAALEGGSK